MFGPEPPITGHIVLRGNLYCIFRRKKYIYIYIYIGCNQRFNNHWKPDIDNFVLIIKLMIASIKK